MGKSFFNNYIFIFCITIFVSLTVYPIINEAHLLYVLSLYLILFFYFINESIVKDLLNSEKCNILIYWINILFITAVLIKIIFNFYSEKNDLIKIENKNSPFYNTYIETKNFEKIKILSNYIDNKNKNGIDVIIIASDSALTMISLNQNHNTFDLVFNGNLGYNGTNNLIQKIKDTENTEFLIYTNEEDLFWQESIKIRQYIKDNLIKTGEICNYTIYKNNN